MFDFGFTRGDIYRNQVEFEQFGTDDPLPQQKVILKLVYSEYKLFPSILNTFLIKIIFEFSNIH